MLKKFFSAALLMSLSIFALDEPEDPKNEYSLFLPVEIAIAIVIICDEYGIDIKDIRLVDRSFNKAVEYHMVRSKNYSVEIGKKELSLFEPNSLNMVKSLTIPSKRIKVTLLENILFLPNLKTLELKGCQKIKKAKELEFLTKLSNIQNLKLVKCTEIEEIKYFCQNLRSLELNKCNKLSVDGLKTLEKIGGKLEILIISGPMITNYHIKNIKINSLKKLYLRECPKITDDCAKHISCLTNLTYLDFYACAGITKGVKEYLKSNSDLEINTKHCYEHLCKLLYNYYNNFGH